MRTAADLLEELNAVDESVAIDAKRASEVGKLALQTICAFCNEPGLGGGYLLLGVEWKINEAGDRVYWPAGLEVDPDKIQSDLASQCASMFNRVVRPEMRIERVDGMAVLVVFVSEVDTAVPPNGTSEGKPTNLDVLLPDLAARISALAGRRIAAEALKGMLLELCGSRAYTVDELVGLFGEEPQVSDERLCPAHGPERRAGHALRSRPTTRIRPISFPGKVRSTDHAQADRRTISGS